MTNARSKPRNGQRQPSPDDEDVALLLMATGRATDDATIRSLKLALFEREAGMYQWILDASMAGGAFTLTGRALDVARNVVSLEIRVVDRTR